MASNAPADALASPASPHRLAHPIVYLALYLPYGISSGYIIVTLTYLLPLHGLSVAQVAGLVALYFLPQTWKVVWAPLIDTTLSLRTWYGIGIVSTSALIIAISLLLLPGRPAQLGLLDVLAFALSVMSSTLMMTTESLMAHTTSPEQMGRAGGWCQAGGLGGQGLGGGAGLWLAQHAAPWAAGSVLALFCVACWPVFWTLPMPPRDAQLHSGSRLLQVGRDVWSIARSRAGVLAGLLVFLPLSTGAASNLWSAVAGDWHANADTVALVNGLMSGAIMAAGCLLGGYLFDLMNRSVAYVISGLALAVCAVAMGLAPHTPLTFLTFVSVYAFFTGWVYAAFTALVLETIGAGAAATKYNVLACLANIPLTYMTLVDGSAQTHFGSAGMLYTEASITVLAALIFSVIAAIVRGRPASAPLPIGDTP